MKHCGDLRSRGNTGNYAWIGMICMVVGWISSPIFGMTAPSIGYYLQPENIQNVRVSLAGSLVGQNGDMTYTIQGPESGGWKSELEWPIHNTVYGGAVVSTALWERFHLNVGGWKSLNKNSGTMKDSDWYDSLRALLLALYDDDTAIYGEFDTTLDALKFDGNLRVDVLRQPSLTLGVLAGYAYTQFEWVTGDGYQHSPISSYNVGNVMGRGILYEQRIKTPYLGLAASFIPQTISTSVNVYALYSPTARCNDVDDHLVRKKKSTGSTRGTFFSFGSDIHIRLSASWNITGMLNYARYDLDGSQNQIFYGGPNVGTRFSDIDMTVTGRQISLGILLRYGF